MGMQACLQAVIQMVVAKRIGCVVKQLDMQLWVSGCHEYSLMLCKLLDASWDLECGLHCTRASPSLAQTHNKASQSTCRR